MGKKERGAEAKVFQAKIFNTSNNTEEDVERERMSGEMAVLPQKHVLLLTGFQYIREILCWVQQAKLANNP